MTLTHLEELIAAKRKLEDMWNASIEADLLPSVISRINRQIVQLEKKIKLETSQLLS